MSAIKPGEPKPELEINRPLLIAVIEKAIARGGPMQEQWMGHEIAMLQNDSIREVARTTKAIDFGAYDFCYGCPVSQAGYRGSYAFWFTNHYDRLMHQTLEVPRALEAGWAVRVLD
jgi:hypothetical protein